MPRSRNTNTKKRKQISKKGHRSAGRKSAKDKQKQRRGKKSENMSGKSRKGEKGAKYQGTLSGTRKLYQEGTRVAKNLLLGLPIDHGRIIPAPCSTTVPETCNRWFVHAKNESGYRYRYGFVEKEGGRFSFRVQANSPEVDFDCDECTNKDEFLKILKPFLKQNDSKIRTNTVELIAYEDPSVPAPSA